MPRRWPRSEGDFHRLVRSEESIVCRRSVITRKYGMHHMITAVMSGSKETILSKRLQLNYPSIQATANIQYSRGDCKLLSRHVLYGGRNYFRRKSRTIVPRPSISRRKSAIFPPVHCQIHFSRTSNLLGPEK